VTDYTVSTNLISWIVSKKGWFGWPEDTAVVQRIAEMDAGDVIVPKFAQSASYEGNEGHAPYQRRVAEVFGVDYDEALASYEATIKGGAGAVPFVMRVTSPRFRRTGEETPRGVPWSLVGVELEELAYPLSTSEYLRLRAVPIAISVQFKATVAKGRHVQELPVGTADAILAAGASPERDEKVLRTETLVNAASLEEAVEVLATAGLPPRKLDRAFVAAPDRMIGLCACTKDGALESVGEPIERSVASIGPLLSKAKEANPKFSAGRPLQAVKDLEDLFASDTDVVQFSEFGQFHDRFVLLSRKVTEALDLESQGPLDEADSAVTDPGLVDDSVDGDASVEELAIEQVRGLSIGAVREALPPGVVVDEDVLAETVTALRAGKHLIFSGPPGTGKSTLASAVCTAVGATYTTATATADWSTVDTIGAYLPSPDGGLRFEEGIVLSALDARDWLVIDEMNRADIDKAFGPLFTLLAGAGGQGAATVTLPYSRDGARIEIGWGETTQDSAFDYTVTPAWRLIGTVNDRDKASLFGLSFAFMRRFAIIDVGLPADDTYRSLLAKRLPTGSEHRPGHLLDAAMTVAHGPVPLGPAILLDIAEFTRRGVTQTATGQPPYGTAAAAFLTAVRLYAVPQYEGVDPRQATELTEKLRAAFDDVPDVPWKRLADALKRAAIAEI
jgi:hypothetical protein